MTGIAVRDLIRRGAQAPPHVSPVDAVMGEDWAYIMLGDPKKLLQLEYLVRREADRTARRTVSISAEILQRRPEAMVKLVGKGGASDAAGLRAQMDYLSRDGEVALQRSERYFGTELDADGREDLVAGWGFGEAVKGGVDHTSHFVVSFPAGTPPKAAEQAGRAWAEALFASGRFGDNWDYYTAFHTDRAHPHLHVVVNRRGLEAGAWLKVSKRSAITFDVLREVQVDVSAEHGIHLVATPRLARGVHDRPASDAAYRRTERAGRGIEGPEHTAVTAVQSAAAVLFYARRFQADADLVEGEDHPLADRLRSAAALLRRGLALDTTEQGRGVDDPKEVRRMSTLIEGRRGEVVSLFTQIDRDIATLDDAAQRARLQRSAAELKAQAAGLLPDRKDLQAYREPASGRYAGIVAIDAYGEEVKSRADAEVVRLEEAYRANGRAMLARYGGGSVPPVLADVWAREEMAALAREHGIDGPLTADDFAVFQPILDARHERIAAIYRRAAEDMAAHEQNKEDLRGLTREERAEDPQHLFRLIRNTLTEEQRQRLETGVVEALGDVTENTVEQVKLARGYLAALQREATSKAERDRAAKALRSLDGPDDEKGERARRVDRDDGHSL